MPDRPYAERSRHPLKRYAGFFCPSDFPPRPQASGKSPQFPTPVFPHRTDDTRARFAVRQPLKTPPILVSHRLGEPIVQWATLAYPPSPSGGHLWRGDGTPPPLFCTPLL